MEIVASTIQGVILFVAALFALGFGVGGSLALFSGNIQITGVGLLIATISAVLWIIAVLLAIALETIR